MTNIDYGPVFLIQPRAIIEGTSGINKNMVPHIPKTAKVSYTSKTSQKDIGSAGPFVNRRR